MCCGTCAPHTPSLPSPSCPTHLLLLYPLSQRVMEQEEDSALLKAYIAEWSKYFTQCSFLPMPFQALETAAGATKFHKKTTEGNRVYTVSCQLGGSKVGGRRRIVKLIWGGKFVTVTCICE